MTLILLSCTYYVRYMNIVHRTSQRHQETPRYADLVKGNALEFLEPGVLFSSDSGLVSERQNVQATGYGCLLALGSRVTCRRHRRGHRFPPKTQQRGGADDAKTLEDDVPAIKHDGHVEVGGSSRKVGGGRKESPSLLFGGVTCVALTQCPA